MTERRGDHGFSVAPRRVDGAGAGRRRRRLTTWVIIVGSVALVVIAVLGPRLRDRPSLDLSFLPTPTPRPTPSRTRGPTLSPVATPLPPLTRGAGPIPPGTIAVQGERLRVLDPASGTVIDGSMFQMGEDALIRSVSGTGWTCICFDNERIDQRPSRTLRLIDIDPSGAHAGSAVMAVLAPLGFTPAGLPTIGTGVDISADRTTATVVLAVRQPDDTFRLSAAGLSLVDRQLSRFEELGTASPPDPAQPISKPSPDFGVPQSEVHLDGPHVRIAPDGGVAFAWVTIHHQVFGYGESPPPRTVAWRLDLNRDGSVRGVAAASIFAELPPHCGYAGFATADRFAWFCPHGEPTGPSGSVPWSLAVVGLDGRAEGRLTVAAAGSRFLGEPLFDRANGVVYVWDPIGLALFRLTLRGMTVEQVAFDPAAELAPGLPPGGGEARPDWHDAGGPLFGSGYGGIAAAADGSRLYLLGFSEAIAPAAATQASLGIFVVDRSTLALVDRWAATANYQAAAMVLDDRALAASAYGGSTADGRAVPWASSLTLHDLSDGRMIVQFGRLGNDMPLVIER